MLPAPTSFYAGGSFGGSALVILAKLVGWDRAVPGSADSLSFIAIVVLVLSLFTNVVFWATRVIGSTAARLSRKILLFASLAVNVSVAFVLPVFAPLPAYWLWLLAFVAVTAAFVVIPADPSEPALRFEKGGVRIDTSVPTLIWIWLGFIVFWFGVTAVNRSSAKKSVQPVAAAAITDSPNRDALTSHFTDTTHVFQPGDKDRFDRMLSGFEKETSNQIAVVIYPRVPSAVIDEFTIRTAELSRLGRKGLDNGAMLFVFMAERTARLEVGYGSSPCCPMCWRFAFSKRI